MAGGLALFASGPAAASEPASARDGKRVVGPTWRVAEAESDDPFSALVGKKRGRSFEGDAAVRVERYVTASQERVFLISRDGKEARMKFLCAEDDPRIDCVIDPLRSAEEIFLLTAETGSRGDAVFRDDKGATFLTIAAYGGATVTWPGEKSGLAASKSYGEETSLRLPFADIATAERRACLASAHLSARARSAILVEFDEPAIDPASGAGVLADAIARAASGVATVASDEAGAAAVARRLERVLLIAAEAPEISMDGKVLEVRYNPALDIAGRPSSADVARFLEETL